MKNRTTAIAGAIAIFSIGLAGCGGGSSDSGGTSGDPVFPSVDGSYSFDTEEFTFTCTDGTQGTEAPISLNLVVTQDGNRIVLDDPNFTGIPGAVVLEDSPVTGNVKENSDFNVTSSAIIDFGSPIGQSNANYNVNGSFADRGWSGDYRVAVAFLELDGSCDYRTTFSGTRLGDIPDDVVVDSLGLNGTWGGIAEDINYEMGTISATVEDRTITQFLIDGIDQTQTSSLAPLASDIFEYLTSDGIYGGMLSDPSKSYGVIVNENWEFGVVQKEASTPYGSATIVDLNGSWSGFFVSLFDSAYFRYPATAECNSGVCVTTATGPAVSLQGAIVDDVTGVQSTATFVHRSTLAFDGEFSNTRGGSGVNTGFLSKDKRFLGAYACQENLLLQECEFGAFVKD